MPTNSCYQYTWHLFGVALAPAVFKKVMDTVLQGLSRVICYLDDILVCGSIDEEHYQNLKTVLQRLQEFNIHAWVTQSSTWDIE